MHAVTAAIFCAMFLLVSSVDGNLEAYLDPGSGSILLQFILGGALAALVAFRSYWDRLKMFVSRSSSDQDTSPHNH